MVRHIKLGQPKLKERERAIELRRKGLSYSEILKQVPVAKSTLSVWLGDVGLTKSQKQRITKKRKEAQSRGATARHEQRVAKTKKIFEDAIHEVGVLSKRDKLMIGTALYWAEGSKERGRTIGQGIDFGNTDASMIKFFIDYLNDIFDIQIEDLSFSLYIHRNHKYRLNEVVEYWRSELKIPELTFSYIYYKKHNPKTKRTNIGNAYFGTVRMRVKKSSTLQRKISGWVYGITGGNWRIV